MGNVGRPRKYPEEFGKVITVGINIPEKLNDKLKYISKEQEKSQVEILAYAIASIDEDKLNDFLNSMKETRELIQQQNELLKINKENNEEIIKQNEKLFNRHKSIINIYAELEQEDELIKRIVEEEAEEYKKGFKDKTTTWKQKEFRDVKTDIIFKRLEGEAFKQGKGIKNVRLAKQFIKKELSTYED